MSQNEKTQFGVSIETPNEASPLAPSVFDTPKTLSPAPSNDGAASPFENTHPFTHANAQNGSLRQQFLDVPTKHSFDISEKDLEAGGQLSPMVTPSGNRLDLTNSPFLCPSATGSRYSINSRPKECTVWPSKETLKEKAKTEKARRREAAGGCWAPVARSWGRMDKRQRLWFKILVALLIAGMAVGLGVGISRAVGGGVWSSSGQTVAIPDNN